MTLFKKKGEGGPEPPPLVALAKEGYSVVSLATPKAAFTIYSKGDDLDRILPAILAFIALLPKGEASDDEAYEAKIGNGSRGYA